MELVIFLAGLRNSRNWVYSLHCNGTSLSYHVFLFKIAFRILNTCDKYLILRLLKYARLERRMISDIKVILYIIIFFFIKVFHQHPHILSYSISHFGMTAGPYNDPQNCLFHGTDQDHLRSVLCCTEPCALTQKYDP